MKKDSEELVKTCHACQVFGDAIHTHPNVLQDMTTPWPFHPWGLDLIRPINPPSNGYIWILAATENFTKWIEAVPLKKAIGAAMANFIREHIITRFGIPRRLISDNGTPFINKDMKNLTEAYYIKHGMSILYYPQGNGQTEVTNKVMLKILKKMKHKYRGKWSEHLADVLWACRSFVKTATGFSPFSLVYRTEVISPMELVVPTPRVVLEENQKGTNDTNDERRVADLEGLEEEREMAKRRSQRYQQRMAKAYAQIVHLKAFTEGQLVLRTVEHVRRNLPGPSKFSLKWEGPYIIREVHNSGY